MIPRILTIFFFTTSLLQAQGESKLAGLPGAPFRLGFGAQGIAFGNALVATRMLPIVGYYNPALVPFQTSPSAQIAAGFMSLDRHLAFLTYGRPIRPSGGISLGIINAGVSDIEGRDTDGRSTGSMSTSENAFLLSFGVKATPRFAVGISTKILYYKLYTDLHSTTIGFDFGALYLISDELTLGIAIQDVGSNYKWDTTKLYGLSGNTTREFFPVRKRLGLSYAPTAIPLIAAVELERIASTTMVRSGIHVELLPEFSLTAGIDQLDLSAGALPKPSMGFTARTGLSGMTLSLDYAFVLEPYAPSGYHLVSISMNFE